MRTPEDLAEAYEAATKESPIIIVADEAEGFVKGMKILQRKYSVGGRANHYITSDIDGYTCPVTNKWVDGKAAHRENLKRTGCRVFEPGERTNFIKEQPKEIERNAEKAADFLSDRIAERWGE